ncbi:CHAD domain-containing protein [Deinococcus altitudinis]|uniref:CHAD domain-containing protein n=1 Tax=Deinococcus altitudinis TaxID=468914 RepID=UPI003891AD54
MHHLSKSRKRLKRLWTALQQGDPEAVHEARKLTRRAQAEQHVAGTPGHVRREWRALRQTVAVLRDRDVAGTHLISMLEEFGAPRADTDQFKAAWAIRRALVLAELALPKRPSSYVLQGHWKRRVRATLAEDRTALHTETAGVAATRDPVVWHTFRKHLKRYRYTAELLETAPQVVLDVLDHLGQLQDAQVLLDLLGQEAWLPSYRDRLMEQARRDQEEARQRVRQRMDELNAHFGGEAVPS